MSEIVKTIYTNFKEYESLTVEDHGFEDDGPILMHKTINKNPDKGDQVGDTCEMIVFKDIVYEEKCVS